TGNCLANRIPWIIRERHIPKVEGPAPSGDRLATSSNCHTNIVLDQHFGAWNTRLLQYVLDNCLCNQVRIGLDLFGAAILAIIDAACSGISAYVNIPWTRGIVAIDLYRFFQPKYCFLQVQSLRIASIGWIGLVCFHYIPKISIAFMKIGCAVICNSCQFLLLDRKSVV